MVGGLGGAQVVIATRKVKQESGKVFLESARKAGRDALLAGAPLVQLPSRYSPLPPPQTSKRQPH